MCISSHVYMSMHTVREGKAKKRKEKRNVVVGLTACLFV